MVKKKEMMEFKANTLKTLAYDMFNNVVDERDIVMQDITDIFLNELNFMITERELINIQINGEVRMGKSTLAIYLGQYILHLINDQGLSKEIFDIQNIARDQHEFLMLSKNPDLYWTVLVTDEWNELEETGENATLVQHMLNHFSNVFAGRYVHKVSVCPKGVIDKNSSIMLEVQSRNSGIVHAYLYFNIFKAGIEHMQLLGHVNLDVSNLINNWLKYVEPVYFMPESVERTQMIDKYEAIDVYVQYMVKKYQKMDLLQKEKIIRPRMLYYAPVVLQVVEDLKPLQKLNILNDGIIKNSMKIVAMNHNLDQTTYGEMLMIQEIKGILLLYSGYYKLIESKQRIKKQVLAGKMTQTEFDNAVEEINRNIDSVRNILVQQKQQLERMIEINKEYSITEYKKIER